MKYILARKVNDIKGFGHVYAECILKRIVQIDTI